MRVMKLVDKDTERNDDFILLSDLIIDQFINRKRDIPPQLTKQSELVYSKTTKAE